MILSKFIISLQKNLINNKGNNKIEMIEKYPLMKNNIVREDLDLLINFLKQDDPILTQSVNVKAFEEEWSRWLGVKYSVFVNSGASANLITIASLKNFFNDGQIIVPTLTWVSDIASVIQNGFEPVRIYRILWRLIFCTPNDFLYNSNINFYPFIKKSKNITKYQFLNGKSKIS